MPEEPRYHLRFQIAPNSRVQEIARDLARFCGKHGVEEVVLFYAAEERNTGLLSPGEEDRWFEAAGTAATILKEAGVEVSLNPWMTVLHTSRGRGFPEGWNFVPTVSPEGEASTACASFADDEWRRYVTNQYARFATLGFRVLWVEDDFRYHNHTPLEWGGGFEEPILERFAKKIDRRVRREEVVEAILQPGPPHPWRALWMENWREIQLEVAELLASAVADASPRQSALGLMSSSMEAHGVEGRRWKRLFEALSIDGRVVHRPHFAGYRDGVAKGALPWSIMMLDLQRSLRPEGTEVAPEVENFPFTHWNKADAQTWCEMALALFYGSDALLLDLFPFTGNAPSDEPEIGTLLDRSRPGLAWIAERFTHDMVPEGVGYLWYEDAEEHVQVPPGARMHDLDASPGGPVWLLPGYGIPVAAGERQVNALFGSLAWAVPDNDLARLLEKGLLLDGRAAGILCRRGYSGDIGVEFDGWAEREGILFAMEQAVDPAAGVSPNVFLNCNVTDRLGVLKPLAGAAPWTMILSPVEEQLFPGTVTFENSRGGRVFTFAAPDPHGLPPGYHRQNLTRSAISFLSSGAVGFPTVTGAPHLMPMVMKGDDATFVVVANAGVDPARPVVHLPRAAGKVEAALLAPLSEPRTVSASCEETHEGTTLTADADVPHFGFLVLHIR